MSAAAALQNPQSNGKLWGVAIACALFLHVAGVVAAFVTLRGEMDDDASGAPAIELSLEPAAPRDAEAADLPPGPTTDETAAAAPSVAASEAKETNEEKIAHAEADDAELSHSKSQTSRSRRKRRIRRSRSSRPSPPPRKRQRRRSPMSKNTPTGRRARPGRRRGGARGQAYVAQGADGASQPRQALSGGRRAASGGGERLLHARQARPCRQLQRQTLVRPPSL